MPRYLPRVNPGPELELVPSRPIVVAIDWMGRPWLVNAAYGMSHWERRKRKAEWRAAGAEVVRLHRLKPMTAARFRVQGRYQRGPLPDPSGVQASFKAVLDGMVDAGILPGDTGLHVRAECYIPAVVLKGKPDALVVEITPLEPG